MRLGETPAVSVPVEIPGFQQQVAGPDAEQVLFYAPFLSRALAFFLDSLILCGGLGLPVYLLTLVLSALPVLSAIVTTGLSLVLSWAYFSILESSERRGTPGKILFGLAVTDLAGNPISLGRATLRFAVKVVSFLLFCVGFATAAFTVRRQTVHDLVSACVVVKSAR